MTDRPWWGVLFAIALFVAGFLFAVEAHAIDPPSNWFNARTLAIGRFGGTDDEIGQCYFSVGAGASLALHPTGEPCVLARELIGRTGTLLFVPD